MSTGISITGLNKAYGTARVLRDIDLEVEVGAFTVLLGPSGCGKSTLLSAIAGLDDVDSGAIRIGGKDVTNEEPDGRGIAMVFQSYALYPTMSVRKNLSFGLRVARIPKTEIERRVAWVANLLQITPLLDRKPAQLSGGQRQRVAIGRALVRESKVFLFDEPLSNLDAKLRTEMRVEIKRLHQTLGSTVVYVTHDQVEAMTLASKIAVMKGGRIEQYADPETLYEKPATLFVAGFVGSPAMNFLPARLEVANGMKEIVIGDRRLSAQSYRFADAAVPGEVVLGIRPEAISPTGDDGTAWVEADFVFAEPMGADTLVWFETAGQRLSARFAPQAAKTVSGRCRLAFDMEKISLFSPTTEQRL